MSYTAMTRLRCPLCGFEVSALGAVSGSHPCSKQYGKRVPLVVEKPKPEAVAR